MSVEDPYDRYPDILHNARGKFKVAVQVETARLSEEWVEDAPGPTVRTVAVYMKDDEDAEEVVRAISDGLGLREHEPAHDPAQGKLAFVPDE